MIFNVTGGGGAALNFKVLAYATEEELLAATPSENTIGIITDTPITSWLFSAEEPSPAEAGKVWITTGTYSPAAFNALKKNGIQVYPISAKQYIGGAWVDKVAKSYQGGEWVEWITYLYNKGDEYANITGGWIAVTKRWASSWSDADAGKTAITKGTTSVKATFSYNGTNYASGLLCIADDFDLTGKKYIKARCKISAANQYTYGWLGVFDRNVPTVEDAFVAYAVVDKTEFSEITVPIEDANLNGLYAIGIGMRVDGINNVSPEIEYLEVG